MKNKRLVISVVLIVILSAALACGGPLAVGGPTPEYPTVAVSTESAQSLTDKFESLKASTGEVTVSITESELTSFIAEKLAAQPDSALSNPQVYLRDGKIKLYATVTTSSFTANALIVVNVTLVDGQMAATIEKADFGPVPVPSDLLSSLTSTINDNLLALADKLPSDVRLKSIAIADGNLTLTADVK
ncbi:MAG: LmeA family phospholipid-binding protein [Chloroflexi bacterium]|nr:LmeA family phospholipid-binding protein [Chloroflexota bacterium]